MGLLFPEPAPIECSQMAFSCAMPTLHPLLLGRARSFFFFLSLFVGGLTRNFTSTQDSSWELGNSSI